MQLWSLSDLKNTGNTWFKALCLLLHASYYQYMSWYDTTLSQLWILYFPNEDDILEVITKRTLKMEDELTHYYSYM